MKMKIAYFCLFFLLLTQILFSQAGSLAGKVTDESGHPFPSLNIIIVGTGHGTITDDEGNYQLKNVTPDSLQVKFSAVGYETQVFRIRILPGKRYLLNVQMKIEAIQFGTIEVTDKKKQEQGDTRTSFLNLSPRNAKILPGAAEDVMRSLQSLPGVLAPNDFSSQLIVRGSGPDQNLIIMDDIEVFNPYRLYGVISMFNPEAVSDITLISGGFPVRYGDRLSAVLDVTNKEGNTKNNLSGSVNLSIIDANVILEGKNPLSIPGSWIINSRRTYYDLVIEPFVKNAGLVDQDVSFPNFYDVQGKIVFGPFNDHKFIINGIHSRDGVDIVSSEDRKTPDSVGVYNATTNDVLGLAWHYIPNERLLNKLVFSYYRNGGLAEFDSRVLDPSLDRERFKDILTDTLSAYLLNINFNTDFLFRKYSIDDKFTFMWGDNTFEAGAGLDLIRSEIILNFAIDPQLKSFFITNPRMTAFFNNIKDVKNYKRFRFYTENNFSIDKKFYLHPGIRFDYYDVLKKLYFSPRISLSYALDDLTTLRGVWGTYYQSPGYEKVLDQSAILDLNSGYAKDLTAENALHYVFGIERWLTQEWNLRVEGYYKDFSNLIVQKLVKGTRFYTEPVPGEDPRYLSGWTAPIPVKGDSLTQIPVNDSYGEAYGIEILLAKRYMTEEFPFSGWISFSHAYAYRFDYGERLPFRFDQRNTVNIVMNYQFNSWFSTGIRWQYGSGFPITEPVGITPRMYYADYDLDGIPETPIIATRKNSAGEKEVIYDVDFGNNKLSGRKPPYHRLDVRFNFLAHFWSLNWTFYLDVINAYNRANVVGYDYFVTPELTLGRKQTSMFPIVPTIGISVKF